MEATIKIRAFPYYQKVEDPLTGQERTQEYIARRGDVVDLSEEDYARAVRFDAIGDPQEYADAVEAGVVDNENVYGNAGFDFQTAEPAELAEYIKGEKPGVDDLVTDVGDDAALAQRVLDAENLATGQQPRSTLVEKLQKVIADNS